MFILDQRQISFPTRYHTAIFEDFNFSTFMTPYLPEITSLWCHTNDLGVDPGLKFMVLVYTIIVPKGLLLAKSARFYSSMTRSCPTISQKPMSDNLITVSIDLSKVLNTWMWLINEIIQYDELILRKLLLYIMGWYETQVTGSGHRSTSQPYKNTYKLLFSW